MAQQSRRDLAIPKEEAIVKRKRTNESSVHRRQFLARTLAGGAGIITLPTVLSGSLKTITTPGKGAESYIRTTPKGVLLGNGRVEFVFDSRSGAITRIVHKTSGRSVDMLDSAAAPVKIWVSASESVEGRAEGSAERPDETQVRISQGAQKVDACKRFSYPEGSGVEFHWENLLTTDGRSTIVSVRQRYELDNHSEFLRASTDLVNGGDLLVTGLFLGFESLNLGGDPSHEVLTVPNGQMGKKWHNPRLPLAKAPLVFCIPPTVPGGLVCTWIDLGGPDSGLGIGYLNRRGMDMLGEVAYDSHGASLGWRMFRLEGGWTFMTGEKLIDPRQVYPLRPGEGFSTDDWFLGFHAGDWHETALFYRNEYERVFQGDFLPWEKVSPTARNADLILDVTAAWGFVDSKAKGYVPDKGEIKNHFSEVPQKVQEAVSDSGAKPENVLMVMLGQGPHWGIYELPDYFPANQEAGGQAAFKEMIHRLRSDIGIAGTHFYTHMVFDHPKAANYIPEADTGWNEDLYFNFDAMGNVACLDCQPWFELWKNKIIPEFVESGASGIEVDEGFGHHLTCRKPNHLHGDGAESILTAQTRGALRIYRQCREAFGEQGYLECEGGSDVYARLVDIWEAGGKGQFEIVRFTHPDKLIVLFVSDPESVCLAFLYGMLVIHNIPTPDKIKGVLKQFIALRREIREKRSPGYPHGFRDDRGLIVVGSGVSAKVFSDHRGITVAYYSKEAASAEISVDGRALGHPRMGVRKHAVKLTAGQMGYFTVE